MLPCDVFCRVAAFPKFMNGEVFDGDQFLKISQDASKPSCYAISIASKFILKDADGVHRYGKAYAQTANERFRIQKGRDPSEADQCVYLGYLSIYSGDIMKLKLDYHDLEIRYREENGSKAHFQIEFSVKNFQVERKKRTNERLAAVGILMTHFFGPTLDPEVMGHSRLQELASLLPIREDPGCSAAA